MKRSTKFLFFGIGLGLGLFAREIAKNSKRVTQAIGPHALEWVGRGASLEDLTAELEASGNRNLQQLMEKMPTEWNYKQLNHIVGIERWGQQRLRVGLGAPFKGEEYDSYRPPLGVSWNELHDIFDQTRQETLNLTHQLIESGSMDEKILHNDLGDLSVKQWLTYLRIHANTELWRMN